MAKAKVIKGQAVNPGTGETEDVTLIQDNGDKTFIVENDQKQSYTIAEGDFKKAGK